MTLAGTVLGAAGALALTQSMQSLVFDMSASDPVTFAAVASYIPARRASRMDPMRGLRKE